MKRFLSILSLVILGFASVACYDDAELRESIEDLDSRVKTLETLCSEMNTNITSLVAVVNAMQKGDYVVSVSPLKEDGVEVGYRIVFKESGVVDLYHGKDGADGEDGKDGANGADGTDGTNGTNGADGKDGHSPVLGTKQAEDGAYYWTVDGEWVLDGEGNRIPLVTVGATPELKIENNTWYVTYDGETWEEVGAAVAVGIKSIETVDGELVITMADGSTIEIPLGSPMKVVLGEFDVKTLQYGSDLVIPYTIEGIEGDVVVFLLSEGSGFAIELVEEAALAGKVTISQIEATEKEVAGKIGIFAVAEDGTTVSQAVRFVSGVFATVEGNEEEYAVDGKGGKVEFKVATNGTFEVETGADWVTYVETKAVEEKTLTFEVAANEGEARTADVKITSGKIELGFTIAQAAASSEPERVETLVGAYKMRQIWVYGGTGPEWGSAGWVDVYTKTWWFDQTSGHGIAAELDNYFEFTLKEFNAEGTQSTGTCVNWAGANGKNWDCWFHDNKKDDGSYRIADGAKDVNSFYRQIPIGTSTWVRDYTVTPNTVTFTDAEGKQTVLKIYEKAETASVFVPGYKDSKAETNTRYFPGCFKAGETAKDGMDLTFHATVKGKDNWDSARSYELDKIYYNPRDIFFDVQKFDSVPEESKTTEAKYTPTIPERPSEEVELPTSLAGTYKFRDGKTVGGKDGKITAKGLVEQYGTWDPVKASINSMKDDKFTFTATGTDADGNETGTVTFDKGADGATWNYKLLDNMNGNKEYDGTAMYCIISTSGTTTYVFNPTEGKVTLTADGREYVVDFLVPGTYKYSTKDITVPTAAAFGFHLDLGYTEARVANYSNTDNGFARHYVWARDHVFMFDKE